MTTNSKTNYAVADCNENNKQIYKSPEDELMENIINIFNSWLEKLAEHNDIKEKTNE